MNDLEEAVRLYENYKSHISFGIHLNLTEGDPLIFSEQLAESGLYKIINGKNVFNVNNFRYKYLSPKIEKELYKELDAQITTILDTGIKPSHIDSHHHIHNGISILPVVVSLAKNTKYEKLETFVIICLPL